MRYGLSRDKLYQSWLVYGLTELTIGSLNAGHPYVFRVDAFNENGITTGPVVEVGGD